MEIQHLQDIYQAESILTNCTPAQGPLPCYRVELSTHTLLFQGPPAPSNPSYAPFFFSLSPPPFLPVSQCGSGSEGYFTRPLRSANLSPTFGEFLQIGISWGAEQSAMRWLSPLRLPPPPLLQHPLYSTPPSSLLSPTQLGRDLHSSLVAETLHYTSFPFSLFISHICLSAISPNDDTSQREGS